MCWTRCRRHFSPPVPTSGISPGRASTSWPGSAAHADRISDLHVKDMDLSIAAAARQARTPYFDVMAKRFFLEPGLGDIPIAEALASLPDDFSGDVIVEVDKPSMEPFASARASWDWIAANYPEAER